MKIAVLGAGGHGQVIASVLSLDPNIEYKFFDDRLDYPDFTEFIKENIPFIVAIGDNEDRYQVFNIVSRTHEPQTVYHPSVMLPFGGFDVGDGSFINAGVIINTGVKIGDNVIVNTGAIIEHHCVIRNHVHIAPGAVLCGGVEVGEGALIGANSTVLSNVPEWRTVKAGSLYNENTRRGI